MSVGVADKFLERVFDIGRLDDATIAYPRVLTRVSATSALDPAWENHLGMARILNRRGDREGALQALRTAAALVEGSRLDLQVERAPRGFLADRLGVYALLASTLAGDGTEERARAGLLAAERARQRVILAGWSRARRSASREHEDWRSVLVRLSSEATRLYEGPGAVATWQDIEARWEGAGHVSITGWHRPEEALVEYLRHARTTAS